MSTKLLKIYSDQQEIGILGYENGLFRFHYSSNMEYSPEISPLMPRSRVFYESSLLFPVFDQWIANQSASGDEQLQSLQSIGHFGLGPLSYVNPDSPRLDPRRTITEEVFLKAGSLNELLDNRDLERGLHKTGMTHVQNWKSFCVHTRANSRYPDSLFYCLEQACNTGQVLEPAAWMSRAQETGLAYASFQTCSAKGSILLKRPDLTTSGHRRPCHVMHSLAGMHSGEAKALDGQTQYRVACRLLRFFAQTESISHQLDLAMQTLPNFNPLLQIWLIQGKPVLMP